MFRIHHILKAPDRIVPWGEKEKYLHWFGLTDGLLWIRAGDSVIYEYAEPHEGDFGESINQIVRFAEDLLDLTPLISESLPEELYGAAETMGRDLRDWNLLYTDLSDDEYDRFCEEAYESLSGWFYGRCMSSAHLKGGPYTGFFRRGGRIKIVWDSDVMYPRTTSSAGASRGCSASQGQHIPSAPCYGDHFYEAFFTKVFFFGKASFSSILRAARSLWRFRLPLPGRFRFPASSFFFFGTAL